MDENYALFVKKFGEGTLRRDVPESSIDYFRGKLPDQMLTYWKEYGWCSYAVGLFWTVNPQEFEPALDAWLSDTHYAENDTYHVSARSAFGDLYCYGEKTGFSLEIDCLGSYVVTSKPVMPGADLDWETQFFFGMQSRDVNDFADLFAPALEKFGPLDHDEMYGFVPALALGGQSKLKYLQKLKTVEHLMILSQLEELRDVKEVMY
jgi:hypothetical protein